MATPNILYNASDCVMSMSTGYAGTLVAQQLMTSDGYAASLNKREQFGPGGGFINTTDTKTGKIVLTINGDAVFHFQGSEEIDVG